MEALRKRFGGERREISPTERKLRSVLLDTVNAGSKLIGVKHKYWREGNFIPPQGLVEDEERHERRVELTLTFTPDARAEDAPSTRLTIGAAEDESGQLYVEAFSDGAELLREPLTGEVQTKLDEILQEDTARRFNEGRMPDVIRRNFLASRMQAVRAQSGNS
jgi:hypothetical protein